MSLVLMNLSLARAHLDRAAHLRTDEGALDSIARVVVLIRIAR